jgi:phytoene/squalene synthetase
MDKQAFASEHLAAVITKAASKQTYTTIRFFVDHERVAGAYRAYGYFRWVDDVIDEQSGSIDEKIAFASRQAALLEVCYRRETPDDLLPEEAMLVDLVRNDREQNSGLQVYLRNMMDLMLFDAGRRGRIISQVELGDYSRRLATAVTEALYYFIGHDQPTPYHDARYLAVTAAHITHMLRDTLEDAREGYFNIPGEVLTARGIGPQDVTSPAYREWVCGRVELARRYFRAGRERTALVRNWRCRLAGYAYIARFEWLLDTITRDQYSLRNEYRERKSLATGLWMGWSTLTAMLVSLWMKTELHKLTRQQVRSGK